MAARVKNSVTDIKQYTINVPPYNQEVYLITHPSSKFAAEYINSHFDNIDKVDEDDKCRGFQWKTFYKATDGYEKARFFIYINSAEVLNTTVEHETVHLAWEVLDHVGIHITNDNHEAFTYFYEYILGQIRECLDIKLIKQ